MLCVLLLLGSTLIACKNKSSKKTFEEEVNNVDVKPHSEAEYHFTQTITYLGNEGFEERDYLFEYNSEYNYWWYFDDELEEEVYASVDIPNISSYSVEDIYTLYSPAINNDDYKVTYTYYTNPLSFSAKVTGTKKDDTTYKDFKGDLNCSFDEYGWLTHLSTHFERYMLKTNSVLIEEINIVIIYR